MPCRWDRRAGRRKRLARSGQTHRRHRRHLTLPLVQSLQRPQRTGLRDRLAARPRPRTRQPTQLGDRLGVEIAVAVVRHGHPWGHFLNRLLCALPHPSVCGCAGHAARASPRSAGLSAPIRLSKRRPGRGGRRHRPSILLVGLLWRTPNRGEAGAAGSAKRRVTAIVVVHQSESILGTQGTSTATTAWDVRVSSR